MYYPYDNFIKYLLVIKRNSPQEIKDIFKRWNFNIPDSKNIQVVRKKVLYRLESNRARKDFRKGKKVAVRWIEKLGLKDATPKTIVQLRNKIIQVVEIRRIIECLVLKGEPSHKISETIYEKYRANLSAQFINIYKKYFWNDSKMEWEQWVKYISKMEPFFEKAIRLKAIYENNAFIRNELSISVKLDHFWAAKQIAIKYYFYFEELFKNKDPLAIEVGNAAFDKNIKIAQYESATKPDTGKVEFMKKLELETRKFAIPAIGDLKERAEDIPFSPIKAIEHKEKEKMKDILEIPIPKKKEFVKVEEIIDEPTPEPFGDEEFD